MYVTVHRNPGICVEKNGFLVLNNFKMLARFYKYDFRIPGQILDFKIFDSKKKLFFSKLKKILKKCEILKKWRIFGIVRIFNGFP